MPMHVGRAPRRHGVVGMLVMDVVDMVMLVLEGFVLMPVPVVLSQ